MPLKPYCQPKAVDVFMHNGWERSVLATEFTAQILSRLYGARLKTWEMGNLPQYENEAAL
jgi:hypothetical protein